MPAFDVDPDRSIGYLIRATNRLVLARLAAFLEPHGVTLGQYFVLRELWEHEGLTQRELSARVGIREPSTVAALHALQRRGLVVRVRGTADRRTSNVHLTGEGRAVRATFLEYAASIVDGATAAWPDGEVETLRALLQRLHRTLGTSG